MPRSMRLYPRNLSTSAASVLLACLQVWMIAIPCPADSNAESELEWREITKADVQGLGWSDTESPFDRLPARAQSIVRPPVWELARHASGVYVDFNTNSPTIASRWSLTTDRLAMPHMPATGVSGVDLYMKVNGKWQFLANGRPGDGRDCQANLATDLPHNNHTYRIYFPLYNGVSSFKIGVAEGAHFQITSPDKTSVSPIVVYGTSITQGGCASRPGMSYTSILGRRLNLPVINLGFSGNGKAEPEVAKLLAELKPAAFVLDPLPNLFASDVAERIPSFIDIVRREHPNTPIFLMESPRFPRSVVTEASAERVNMSNERLKQIHAERIAAGDRQLWLIPASDFTTDGGEGTVDGIHPTDLGFMKLADSVEEALRSSRSVLTSPTAN